MHLPSDRPSAASSPFAAATLAEIAARFGTPTWVYDLDAMAAAADALTDAFEGVPHLIAYAVKANSAGPILKRFAARGLGADVVSGPELALALAAGIPADRIVFSGVAKTCAEIDRALFAGDRGILALQAESHEELVRIAARAKTHGRVARVALRINPELESIDTHQGIATGHDDAKFGVPISDLAPAFAALNDPALAFQGLSVHAGSQLLTPDEYLEAARILFGVARDCPRKSELRFLDTGGGFGIDYGDRTSEKPVPAATFVRETRVLCKEFGFGDLPLHIEPGRVLVAPYGHLLSRVVQRKEVHANGQKERRWLMIDAGMNDLVRPAMYQARHRVTPVAASSAETHTYRVVGPICESSDDFGFHTLPSLEEGDLVLLRDGGAYGYPMASRYNGRAFAAEVFLENGAIGANKPREAEAIFLQDRLDFATH